MVPTFTFVSSMVFIARLVFTGAIDTFRILAREDSWPNSDREEEKNDNTTTGLIPEGVGGSSGS